MIDGHLDLAYNALAAGRDLTLPLDELRRDHPGALVTLPELAQGGVRLIFGTVFVMPAAATLGGSALAGRTYETPAEARALALEQLELYERWEDEGRVRIVRTKGDLAGYLEPTPLEPAPASADLPIGLVVLMEGADPLRTPDDLAEWTARGLRVVGPAWQRTRYAGGTRAPGPLTDLGVELMHALRQENVVLDTSHLAEESFWNALETGPQHVIASHSNARTLTPTDRHLSDAMIRALGAKDGVMGLVIANLFLDPDKAAPNSATLADVTRHAEHVAGLIGWDKLAVGTDWDGGFGADDVPAEITRAADFARLGEVVPEAVREDFLGGTWLRFLQRALPE